MLSGRRSTCEGSGSVRKACAGLHRAYPCIHGRWQGCVHVFRADKDAVIRNLQVMCESVSRVSEDVRSIDPGIEWRGIAGLRNILVHDYLGVDNELVWQVVESRLPDLKSRLETLLTSL